MTKIPRHFVELFQSLRWGDSVTLHKGPGEGNWKIELVRQYENSVPHVGRAGVCIVASQEQLWSPIFATLPDEWQGSLQFTSSADQHRCVLRTCPPLDLTQGWVSLEEK